MADITKEVLIKLWCDSTGNADNPEVFNFFGSSEQPGFGIIINDKISLTIDGIHEIKSYSINLIFSDVVRYKSFIIEEIDYMSLLEYWETGSNHASKIAREILIKEGLEDFNNLVDNK